MDFVSSFPQSPALLHSDNLNPSSPSTAVANQPLPTQKSGNEGIDLDVFSLETTSQPILVTRSLPSSPTKLDSYKKQSKSIEDLRKKLMLLKESNQAVGPASSSSNCCFAKVQQAETMNQLIKQRNNAIQPLYCINEETSIQEMPEDGVNAKALEDGNVDPGRQRPLMKAHGNKQLPVIGDKYYGALDNYKLGSLCDYPLGNSMLPLGNTYSNPSKISKSASLPPHQVKSNLPADVGPFPPLNSTKSPSIQPNDSTYLNP